jgi:hypothetical protein
MLARDEGRAVFAAVTKAGVRPVRNSAPEDDYEMPTEYPASADGEPIFEPLNGTSATAADFPGDRPLPAKSRAAAERQAKEILPFETFDASQWEGVPIEPRRWIGYNRIPVGEPGIMSGDGGTGKTKLAMQLAAAIAACLRDWIGGVVDAEGQVIVFSAEEKLKEMHRRTLDIIEHRGLSFSDLRGGLHFICDQDDAVLGAVDRHGVVQPTMSLSRLEKTVAAIRPALVIVENAADVYSGNESDRPNVTRFMRSLLGRLTVPCESAVMLIGQKTQPPAARRSCKTAEAVTTRARVQVRALFYGSLCGKVSTESCIILNLLRNFMP